MGMIREGDLLKTRYPGIGWYVVKGYRTNLLIRAMTGRNNPVFKSNLQSTQKAVDEGLYTVIPREDCIWV